MKTLCCAVLVAGSVCLTMDAEAAPARAKETPGQRAERMEWWTSARFGMFVHWGIYSVVGGEYKGQKLPNSAEWMMCRGKIPIAEYEEYAARFNPVGFDADAFVGLAKEAGMKYLVITAKHHDGFSMFHSKASPYNVVDATPFKRDIMKELAEACAKHGLRFGFYYSQCQDWHHPGGMGNSWDRSIKRVSFDEYVQEKAAPEISQLLTEYGPIGIFWWDTPRTMSEEAFDALHSSTDLQPDVITNDRLGKDFPGDHKTFERHVPKQAPPDAYWEVCMPISGSWGYKKSDRDFKSASTLIRHLVDIASKGGNYLLNVSPTGNGTILPEAVGRLQAIGQWMKINSESIYGTSASPLGKPEWGRCTQKKTSDGTTLYLHVFDWPEDGELLVTGLKNDVRQAHLLADGTAVKTRRQESDTVVSLPRQAPDEIASVIVLEIGGELEIGPILPKLGEDGRLVLAADAAYIHNNEGTRDARVVEHDGVSHIGYWTDAEAFVEWSFIVEKPGTFSLHAELGVEEESSRFRVGLPGHGLSVRMASTGGYYTFSRKWLGTIRINDVGVQTLRVRPEKDGWNPINLRKLEFKRRE